jgi:endonuclease/exonuclease/phosphatase family metal-dependent hydrolase
MKKISLIVLGIFIACNSLVTKFDDVESAIEYSADSISGNTISKDNISVMTWNIRFGTGRIDWFGDHCGDRVILSESEIIEHLDQIVVKLNESEIDILLLQEIDVDSKRSAYIDEVQYILDRTHFNYGVFASMWQAQVIPSDGLGRVNTGNAILSRWELSDSERIQLDLMTDQEAIVQYFYLRRNIIKAKVEVPGKEPFYAVNTHLTAFATDDTKKKHVEKYISTLDDINNSGFKFVSGGDLNSLPPVNDDELVPDFCVSDACEGEIFHNEIDDGPHKAGSYFENDSSENTWLEPLYENENYTPGINFDSRLDSIHYTHSPGTSLNLDRKLDYLFTNLVKLDGSENTLQEYKEISDHVPVIMNVILSGED